MKKTTVAIFEDDAVNRFIYQQAFRAYGEQADLYIFDRPEEGIEQAKTVPFDVIFIEAHFWESFGGISILNQLKSTAINNPVFIAMTSLLQPGDLEMLMHAGFSLCLEKPITFSEALIARQPI